jgi:folate-binding protein YgfZ
MAEHRFLALPRDILLVRGKDRKTWLDGLLTCAVTTVAPGSAAYGLLLTKQGKIVTDVFLLEGGDSLYVAVAPGRGQMVRELLDRYLVMEDAELSEPATALALGLGLERAPDEALAAGKVTLADLALEVFVVAAPRLAAGDAAPLLAAHGFGAFGVDFGDKDNPHEASLDRVAVSWTKGCYLGQEVVCMQDMRGKVKRRLVALDGEAELLARSAAGADVVSSDGSVVGHVSSVHPAGAGARLLASVSSSALESPGSFTVLGVPVRVVDRAVSSGVGAPA